MIHDEGEQVAPCWNTVKIQRTPSVVESRWPLNSRCSRAAPALPRRAAPGRGNPRRAAPFRTSAPAWRATVHTPDTRRRARAPGRSASDAGNDARVVCRRDRSSPHGRSAGSSLETARQESSSGVVYRRDRRRRSCCSLVFLARAQRPACTFRSPSSSGSAQIRQQRAEGLKLEDTRRIGGSGASP